MDPEKRKGSAPPNLSSNGQFHNQNGSGPGHYSNSSRQASRNASIQNPESPMTTTTPSSPASRNYMPGYIKDAKRPDFNNRINDSMARADYLIKAHNAAKAGRSLSTGNPPSASTQSKFSNGFKKESSPTIVEVPPTPIKKNFDFMENFGIVTNESGKCFTKMYTYDYLVELDLVIFKNEFLLTSFFEEC